MSRRRALLAAGLVVVALAVVVVRLILFQTSEVFIALIAVPFAAVGGLLAVRRPQNPIGWLFLGFGVLSATNFLAEGYAHHAFVTDPGSLPGADLAASYAAHAWHASFGLFVFAFLHTLGGANLRPIGEPRADESLAFVNM